jgi:hypothetical protein
MVAFKKKTPQVAVVLAALVPWASFAWGLPAEPRTTEGEAETTPPSDVVPPEPAAEPPKMTGWLYAGLGMGSGGPAANAGLNVKYGRYSGIACGTIAGSEDYYYDAALLFGYAVSEIVTVAAGVAWTETSIYSGSWWWGGSREVTRTVGVPVEVQVAPVKGRAFGLGIVGHVNFNKEATFFSITAGLQLGKLK